MAAWAALSQGLSPGKRESFPVFQVPRISGISIAATGESLRAQSAEEPMAGRLLGGVLASVSQPTVAEAMTDFPCCHAICKMVICDQQEGEQDRRAE